MSRKREQKIQGLVQARVEFAGIGTRKVKLALNKLAIADPYAHALRVALEIENGYMRLHAHRRIKDFLRHDPPP